MEVLIQTIEKNREAIEQIVLNAGRYMKDHPPQIKDVHRKAGLANFVTDEDIQIQKDLIEKLRKIIRACSL